MVKKSRLSTFTSALDVLLNNKKIGVLNKQASGAISFQYDQEWLAQEHAIPVSLSLPLQKKMFTGMAVQAVFENILPDNDVIRRILAEKTGAYGTDAYSLLTKIGRDCVGALQFLPEGYTQDHIHGMRDRPVTDAEIADIISGLSRNPLGIDDDKDFRISIAGVQEKTALLNKEGQWFIPLGTSPTTHILKPTIGKVSQGMDLSDSVENEYFCMQLMAAFGLNVAKTAIEIFSDQKVLVIERFDRAFTQNGTLIRLPQEDFCQALSVLPTQKYEPDGGIGIPQIMNFLQGSNNPEQDRLDFMKTQILFWLIGATDGHAKNFSIFLLPGGRFRLTPLYDIMSAQPYLDRKQLTHNKMKLAMAVGKNRHYIVKNIQKRHFIETGKICGLSETAMETTFNEIKKAMPNAINQVMQNLPQDFPLSLAESIIAGMKKRIDFGE